MYFYLSLQTKSMKTFNQLTNRIQLGIRLFFFIVLGSVGLLFFIGFIPMKKQNEITQREYIAFVNSNQLQTTGLEAIPKTAFWAGKDSIGHWFNVESIHAHKNNAIISIYSGKDGSLISKQRYALICSIDKAQFINSLDWRIAFYDGSNIKLYDPCYLMPY